MAGSVGLEVALHPPAAIGAVELQVEPAAVRFLALESRPDPIEGGAFTPVRIDEREPGVRDAGAVERSDDAGGGVISWGSLSSAATNDRLPSRLTAART